MVALLLSKGLADSSGIWRWSLILLLVQQVPAITLLVALFLWLSRHSQSPLALYLQGAGIWLGYMLLAAATGSPLMANSQSISPLLSQLMLYLDLYALSPLLAQLQQQGAMPAGLLQLEMTFWLNRLLIVSLAAWLCWRVLRPGTSALPQPEQRRRALSMRSAAQSAAANGLLQNQTQGQYQPCPPGALTFWPVFRGLIQLQWQQLCRQRSTLLALLVLCGLIFSEVLHRSGLCRTFQPVTAEQPGRDQPGQWRCGPTLWSVVAGILGLSDSLAESPAAHRRFDRRHTGAILAVVIQPVRGVIWTGPATGRAESGGGGAGASAAAGTAGPA